MKRLMNYFLKGLLVFVPAALTVFTIVLVFKDSHSRSGLGYHDTVYHIGRLFGIEFHWKEVFHPH